MNEGIVTSDLSRFGYRELDMAGELLKAYSEKGQPEMGDGLKLFMNAHSGNVFLCDDDINVAMMNADKIELHYSCPECGHEGFLEDMEHNKDNKECQKYLKEIKK